MAKKKFYVTTAIDYVNAKPHIGHAFEKVIADALVRWKKQKGYEVFFLTGVDENAQKNVQAAEKEGIPVKQFVDKNTDFFRDLVKKLNISHDKFIRTSAKEHSKVVEEIIKKIIKKSDIYKGKYEGNYCSGCEAYLTEKDLVDGKCPEHNKKPEHISEEAYFFKLSKYKNKLTKFVERYIVPESRKKEILSRLKGDLRDICISRKNAKWGIDFPGDKNFKIWVWIDALINYISGAEEKWPADVHVVGKGINWFHSVIWPAILMSAGYKLPNTLLVHGYLNIKGKKISKSLGNVIDPIELVDKYGADVVRYSLLRCSVFEDSDYSEEILIERNNKELANKLGNLVSRVAGLIEQNGIAKCENKLLKKLKIKEIEKKIEEYEFDKVLNEIFAFIDVCNQYVQQKRPWETEDKTVLYELKESILKIADLLLPFIPESAEKIKKQFSAKNIKKGEILFNKV
jgi:methionyl-tRNA synthetase